MSATDPALNSELDMALLALIRSARVDLDSAGASLSNTIADYLDTRPDPATNRNSWLGTLGLLQGGMLANMATDALRPVAMNLVAGLRNVLKPVTAYLTELEIDGLGDLENLLTSNLEQQVAGLLVSDAVQQLSDALLWATLAKPTRQSLSTAIRRVWQGAWIGGTIATIDDWLFQTVRAYMTGGGKQQYYRYDGTEIATTRSFCHQRVGRSYTKREVESWGGLDWMGRIPGTNSVTIFQYCGGYKCRHRLLPISKKEFQGNNQP